MGETSKIEWVRGGGTWNPFLGCTKTSPGCARCYMDRWARMAGRDPKKVARAADSTFYAPLKSPRWKTPRFVFACSLSDFFHQAADPWRDDAWEVIRKTPQHTYQILTKRPERIAGHLPRGWGDGWPNVWLGVSVESQQFALERIPLLLMTSAVVRFVSCEPLLGPLDLMPWLSPCGYFCTHTHIPGIGFDWVIAGGESDYKNPRPCEPDWLRSIRDQCRAAGVPFFLKQLGGTRRCSCHGAWGCRLLEGRTWDEMPRR